MLYRKERYQSTDDDDDDDDYDDDDDDNNDEIPLATIAALSVV